MAGEEKTSKKAGIGRGFHVAGVLKRRILIREDGQKKPTFAAEAGRGQKTMSPDRAEFQKNKKQTTTVSGNVEENSKMPTDSVDVSTEMMVGSSVTKIRADEAQGRESLKADNKASSRVIAKNSSKILMNPTMEFFTADTTLELMVLTALSIYLTYLNWPAVHRNEIPFSVMATWLLVAFLSGKVYSTGLALQRELSHRSRGDLEAEKAETAGGVDAPKSSGQVKDYQVSLSQEEKGRKHSIVASLLSVFHSSTQLGFESANRPLRNRPKEPWTVLRADSMRLSLPRWQKAGQIFSFDSREQPLISQLARRGYFRRIRQVASNSIKRVRHSVREQTSLEETDHEAEQNETIMVQSDLGSFDLASAKADSLDDFVLEPLFRLRGMDVFLSDDPEYSVGTHPWLIEHGLRDLPTFIVNVLTQWGNILLYFQMPDWVTSWETFVETSSDPDDVKAIKRFFNGDNEYRNKRLKLVPSVVEGPLAVRILAPPKREQIVHCSYMPVSYIKHPAEVRNGRKLWPALEAELDCLTSRAIRGMASIVKKHLVQLSIDVAVVIGKPLKHHEEEPQACLGLWRFDHIDVSSCPHFPDRFGDSLEPRQSMDVLRASQLVNISPLELEEIIAEQ